MTHHVVVFIVVGIDGLMNGGVTGTGKLIKIVLPGSCGTGKREEETEVIAMVGISCFGIVLLNRRLRQD